MKVAAKPAYSNRAKNPYNALLYEHVSSFGSWVEEFSIQGSFTQRYDVVHVHWPEYGLNLPTLWLALSRILSLLVTLKLAKLKGAKLVWTAHNLEAHDKQQHPALEKWFWKVFLDQLDGYVSLSQLGREKLLSRFPQLEDKPYTITPLGHFRDIYPDETNKVSARKYLSIPLDRKVIVCAGAIRPYKNLPHLIKIFQQLDDPDLILLIAGLPITEEVKQEIIAAAEGDDRILLQFGLIPESEFQYYLRAADLVVLPYFRIFNSASALLSLSFECPTLLPDLGAMRELQAQVGKDWIQIYEGELTREALIKAIAWSIQMRSESIDLSYFDWDNIAQETLKFYTSLAGEES
jgi:beta-1,4-mannosyltransferase